jgi:hypothetical protein
MRHTVVDSLRAILAFTDPHRFSDSWTCNLKSRPITDSAVRWIGDKIEIQSRHNRAQLRIAGITVSKSLKAHRRNQSRL